MRMMSVITHFLAMTVGAVIGFVTLCLLQGGKGE